VCINITICYFWTHILLLQVITQQNHCNGFIQQQIIIQMTTKELSRSKSPQKWLRKYIFCRGWGPRPCASVNHRQTGWDPHQRGWSDDACATSWASVDFDGFLKRTASSNGPAGGWPARRRGRRAGWCSHKTQDKFAIESMTKKLLHQCIGAHARVVDIHIYIYLHMHI